MDIYDWAIWYKGEVMKFISDLEEQNRKGITEEQAEFLRNQIDKRARDLSQAKVPLPVA